MNLENLKKEYDKKGFIVLRGIIAKKNLSKINKSLNSFSEKYQSKKKRNLNITNNKINSIHNMEKWSWTQKLRKNEIIKSLVKLLLKNKARNFGSELFAKPARCGLKSPAHQDNYYWALSPLKNNRGLTIWISLSVSEKKNGGVFYFAGSHKIGLLKHKASFAPGSSQIVEDLKRLKKFKKFYPKLQPGDCLIHNAMVVHGSEINNSKYPRKGVTLRYIPKNSKFNKLQKIKYEKSLKKQIKTREINARI
jgi:ectoine hydroxylase-related dioxygenase (phytanoyl-CoA dioxygenase family)